MSYINSNALHETVRSVVHAIVRSLVYTIVYRIVYRIVCTLAHGIFHSTCVTSTVVRRTKDGQFIQSTNCTDKKMVGLAQTGKEAVQYYIATRWGVKMSHAKKYITQ